VLLCTSFLLAEEKLDGIAAVVGNEVILVSEVNAYTLLRLNNMGLPPDSVDMDKYRDQFLQELIDGKVLLVKARGDSTITIKESEVEQYLKQQIGALLQQGRMSIDSLESELKRQRGISLGKFKDQMRHSIREQLLKQRVQQSYYQNITVTRRDVEDFFNEYKDSLPSAGESVLLSKLSLKLSPSDAIRQTAYEKIRLAEKRLNSGEKFENVAKELSESPEASSGGDLGLISKGTLSELVFEEKAFSTPAGQISEPFETRFGFHIIKVESKQDQTVRLRQILIRVAPSEKQVEELTTRLDSIRTNSTSQKDFISAVKKFSVDDASKVHGGRIGWEEIAALPNAIRVAVDSLNKGDITQPIRDGSMVSIYRVDDKKKKRERSLEHDWQVLSEKAKEIMAQKKLIEQVTHWRDEVYIDVRL